MAESDPERATSAPAGDVLARAWPEGVPAEESVYLRSLSDERQAIVVARLEAVLAAEGDATGLVDAARLAGLGRTAFFGLRRAWNANRSLRSLAPYERRRSVPKSFVEPDKRPGKMPRFQVGERTAAVEAIRADPAASNASIAALVAERTATALDPRTLTSLVRQERRLLHFSPRLLLGVYGRSLVADVSALDMTLSEGGEGRSAIAAFLIERSTGLVVGYAVGARDQGVALQGRAAQRAVAFLADERADVALGTPVAMKLVVGPGPEEEIETLANAAGSVRDVEVFATGRLRFGRRVTSLIGRPGRIGLRPMATMPADQDQLPRSNQPSVTIAEGDVLLGAELARHNRSALDALRMVGLAGGGEKSGAMVELLTAVFGLDDSRIISR